jgi:hypothetical protein
MFSHMTIGASLRTQGGSRTDLQQFGDQNETGQRTSNTW